MQRGLVFGGFYALALAAHGQSIREISIHSWWDGFGGRSDHQTTLKANDRTLNARQAVGFIDLLRRPPLERPDLGNLGVTDEAVRGVVDSVASGITPAKLLRLRELVTDRDALQQNIRSSVVAIRLARTDDYPHVEIKVTLDRGEVWTLRSDSQGPFMLPWTIVKPSGTHESYDADIARAIAAWLPPDERNRKRILGEGLDEWLTITVRRQVPTIGLNFAGQLPAIKDVRITSSRGTRRSDVTVKPGDAAFDSAKMDLLTRGMVSSVEQVRLDNLGLGPEWLESHPAAAAMNRNTVERTLSLAPPPAIDSPGRVEVTVTFQHGEQWKSYTESSAPFMLPWVQETMLRARTFDANWARTVAGMLPADDPNRSLLLGEGLAEWAERAVAAK